MRRRFLSPLLAVVLLVPLLASPAAGTALPVQDGARADVGILHDVTCVGEVNAPTKTATAVSVSGAVEGTGPVDVANTYIAVQILEGGTWRNYGNVTSTSSTSRTLILSDGATLKPGTWQYRGRIHREAFHGNWGSNDWYGPSRTFTG